MRARIPLYITAVLLSMLLIAQTALAVDPPTMDDLTSPIDADKITLSGETEPGYKVTITGGSYQIAPTYADDDGIFEIEVALVQESTNTFSIKVQDDDGTSSETIQVVIEETSEEVDADTSGDDEDEDGDAETDDDTDDEITLTDIEGHWAEDYITTLVEWGAIEGYEDGTFLPDATINRAEFIKIVVEAFGLSLESPDEEIFVDVPLDEWYSDYIYTAYIHGIISGDPETGTFRLGDPINRAEAVLVLLETAGAPLEEFEESVFPDVEVDSWYGPYVLTAYSMGIISGYEDGTFGPGDPMTRAETCKVIVELLELS